MRKANAGETKGVIRHLALVALMAATAAISLNLTADSAVSPLPKLKSSDPLPAGLFIELAKKVNPAVVNIYTTYLPKGRGGGHNDPMMEMMEQFMFPGLRGRAMPQQALGTGFLIREDGLIVTNNHVVDRADVIKVQIEEGKPGDGYDAKIVGKDAKTDIALIKIDAKKKKLPYLQMGSSADVQVGEWVAAFGNPLGYGHTMTKGIISAINREIDELNLFPFMQTDASINPGNSGGPLVNTQGLVIGVNTAIDARGQGIGFVIPIDNVKSILPQLEKEGSIKRGILGVGLGDIDQERADALNIEQTVGAVILEVGPGTPAEKAGLEPWDLVIEYDGKKITGSHDLRKAVANSSVGQKVTMKLIRNGKPKTVTAVIATSEQVAEAAVPKQKGVHGVAAPFGLGFTVSDYSQAVRQEFGLPPLRQPRPVIVHVDFNKEAARSGLAPGDIILDVNRSEVGKAKDVVARLKKGTINILRVLKQDRVVLVSLRAN